jgi:hypothetical protein
MVGGSFETGWLELKAVRGKEPYTFKIEQSQHQWMRLHAPRIPAHFLIKTNNDIWLISGTLHASLTRPLTSSELQGLSTANFKIDMMRQNLYEHLKTLTFRGRNGI